MRHFRQVATFDAGPLAAGLQGADWTAATWRQDHPDSPHTDTQTIYARMPEGPVTPELVFEKIGDEYWDPELHDLSCGLSPLLAVAYEIQRCQGGLLARVMAVKLRPGGRIKPHADTGRYAQATERYHAVIRTNQWAWLEAGGERIHMPAGTVWWFDKHVEHAAGNNGSTDRIHLIVDLYPSELRFQEEAFGMVRPEIEHLMHAHWREIGGTDSQPLDPDWERFAALEEAGVLAVLTARDRRGTLAGYIVHVVFGNLHYRTLVQAHDDAHYLAPEYRRGMAACRMFRAAEEMLQARGVRAVTYHTKLRAGNDRGAVFKRLGYEPVETLYRKAI
jgi:quercetin dioxygenase-like cupin family protein